MALRSLPGDYAPGDTPTAAEMNGLKDHAGNSVDRLTTVLRRGTLLQLIAHNSFVPVQWQTVVGGYNGLGWSVGTPSQIPIPTGGNGRYEITFSGNFAAGAGGLRYCGLFKNGALVQVGTSCPGDASLAGWLACTWETSAVPSDYLEVVLFQNKTTVGTLALDIIGECPQVTVKRVEL